MTSKWVWKDREELEAHSPSRKDGISAEREEAKRLAYVSLILDAGMAMKIPMPIVCTAAVYCHQFYASMSMRKNDTWAMATACLFLACKVEERPKALKDILIHMWTIKNRGRVEQLEMIKDREWQDEAKAAVLKAERTLLYVLKFDFHVNHPFRSLLQYITAFSLESRENLPQTAWDLVCLSYRTTMCLQFKAETTAAAAVYAALKLHGITFPPVKDNLCWYQLDPVYARPDAIRLAGMQMLDLMEKLRRFQAKRQSRRLLAAIEVEQNNLLSSQQPGAAAGAGPALAARVSPQIDTDTEPGGRLSAQPSPTTPLEERQSEGSGGGRSERHVESVPIAT